MQLHWMVKYHVLCWTTGNNIQFGVKNDTWLSCLIQESTSVILSHKFNTKLPYKNHLLNQVLMQLRSKYSFLYLCDENHHFLCNTILDNFLVVAHHVCFFIVIKFDQIKAQMTPFLSIFTNVRKLSTPFDDLKSSYQLSVF